MSIFIWRMGHTFHFSFWVHNHSCIICSHNIHFEIKYPCDIHKYIKTKFLYGWYHTKWQNETKNGIILNQQCYVHKEQRIWAWKFQLIFNDEDCQITRPITVSTITIRKIADLCLENRWGPDDELGYFLIKLTENMLLWILLSKLGFYYNCIFWAAFVVILAQWTAAGTTSHSEK